MQSLPNSIALAFVGAILLSACSAEPDPPTQPAATEVASAIAVSAPWSRETAQGQDAGGAFMTIVNTGTAPDRLLTGTTDVAGEVQVHTVDMAGGVMRMRQLTDGLAIPAGGSVTLRPGSFHIMLMQLKRPLASGEMIAITLHFEKAGDVPVEFEVRSIADGEPERDHS